jgi:hypothetical protein
MQRSTFLPIHHAATFISSVDWGLESEVHGDTHSQVEVSKAVNPSSKLLAGNSERRPAYP